MEKNQDNLRVVITAPVVIAPVGGERIHARVGEEFTLPADDVFNLVAGNSCRILEGALPNAMKQQAARK